MQTTSQQIPDFEILQPRVQTCPVVFNSPHSGAYYHQDFIATSRLTPLALRKSEDSFVDELYSAMPGLGCPMLKANFPRAYLDVNRAAWELDPKMFADTLPSYVETNTIRVAAGLGTIARNVSESEKIYRQKLSFTDAKARIERYYFPYHLALTDLINTTRQHFGQTILIDCHSMPSNASGLSNTGNLKKSKNRPKNHHQSKPDIILGDRYGTSSNPDFVDHLEDLFDGAGFNTARNKPYAGGYITKTYGQPAQSVHVIQIEINRSLYMNEKTMTKTEEFESLKQTLDMVFKDFLQAVTQTTQQPSLAAE